MVIHDRITHSANSVHYNALFALEHNAASALRTMSLRLHIQALLVKQPGKLRARVGVGAFLLETTIVSSDARVVLPSFRHHAPHLGFILQTFFLF